MQSSKRRKKQVDLEGAIQGVNILVIMGSVNNE